MKLIFFIFILFIQFSFSQDYNITKIEIKSLDTNNIDDNSFSLNKFSPKGLTSKPPKQYFSYEINSDGNNNNNNNNNDIDLSKKSNLVKPTWKVRQDFSEGNNKNSDSNRDFFLGNIETRSNYVMIKCRDHEYVDGDRIRLMLNGSVIHPNIILSSAYYTVDIDLEDGYNNIDFIALNEGQSSPNTAQLVVLDQFGNEISNKSWLLSTGFKAKLVIFKK